MTKSKSPYRAHGVQLSNYLMPTLRETPEDASIISHQYMLRAGMIRQASSGIYSWLPLGQRVLQKISQIIREEQNLAGAHELLMPTIQSAELWQKSGRYDDYGKEMLRITDRHSRPMLYGPTNEEQITQIFAESVKSYRELPKLVYHIQWKFRDEIRPRFGVMRGREFLMKDGYSFDLDKESAMLAYHKMFIAYLRTYARMGLKAIPMRAPTGPIGGDTSHEFIVLSETGESEVFCDRALINIDPLAQEVDFTSDLDPIIAQWTQKYTATDESHNQEQFEAEVTPNNRIVTRGIEVGHIFFFGDKYAKAMNAFVTDKNGKSLPLQSGSYGIGVSRLLGAIIEVHHDDKGIIWPEAVAPFLTGIIELKPEDQDTHLITQKLYQDLRNHGVEVLWDNRTNINAGAKFNDMDLIGLPWQIIIGPKSIKDGLVELRKRSSNELSMLSPDAAVQKLTEIAATLSTTSS